MEKKGTLASPAMARASRVLPVPGGPISSTPLGMRPPSFWNFWGSLRNSTISWSSSLASSTPATSLNVTFLPEVFRSLALLLPKESALLPPVCIWRMKKIQRPTISSTGAQVSSTASRGFSCGSSAEIRTLDWRSCLTRSGSLSSRVVLNSWPPSPSPLYLPVSCLPRMVTSATFPC